MRFEDTSFFIRGSGGIPDLSGTLPDGFVSLSRGAVLPDLVPLEGQVSSVSRPASSPSGTGDAWLPLYRVLGRDPLSRSNLPGSFAIVFTPPEGLFVGGPPTVRHDLSSSQQRL